MKRIGGLLAALVSTVMVVSVGLAPSAHAAQRKMEGRYETDSAAKIRWTNVLRKGEIFKIRDVRFKNVTFNCDDLSTIRVKGRVVGDVKVDRTSGATVDAPVKRKGKDTLRFSLTFDDVQGNTGRGSIGGDVTKGDRTCTASGGSFNIRRR